MFKKITQWIEKVFGPNHLGKAEDIVQLINDKESDFEDFSLEDLKEKSKELKQKVKKGADLDDVLVDAFALVRETAKQTLGQRHYDVQLVGGIVLHWGHIAEMLTGEGKTLA